MYDAPAAAPHPDCDDPPTTPLWALHSHEPATDTIPAINDDPPTTELHLGHIPQWPTVDPDEAATEARAVLRREYSTDTTTLHRLLHGLRQLAA